MKSYKVNKTTAIHEPDKSDIEYADFTKTMET